MTKLITIILFQLLIVPLGLIANENFSVEIEALTLVMETYEKDIGNQSELELNNKKPSYMALKQDECNATVKVTEREGLEITGTESFDVDVCKREVSKVLN